MSQRIRRLGAMALLGSALALAGCETVGGTASGGVASVNGDTPIATAFSAPPGSNEDFIINVGRRVYFGENTADLSATTKVTLDKQAAWLATYPTYRVKVEGFADEKGGPEVNRALGQRRALAIASYLESKGVAANRLRSKSFGSERPVRSCADISCWSQNRRGVTVLETEIES